MTRFLFVLLLFFLPRCQSAAVSEQLALQLTFPRELAPTTRRFREFLPRVRFLEIAMTTASGVVTTRTLPPGQWSALPLTAGPPGGSTEGFTVQARIWDNARDGRPRSFPVMTTPVRRISPGELQRGEGPIPVHLRFSLHVAEREGE